MNKRDYIYREHNCSNFDLWVKVVMQVIDLYSGIVLIFLLTVFFCHSPEWKEGWGQDTVQGRGRGHFPSRGSEAERISDPCPARRGSVP